MFFLFSEENGLGSEQGCVCVCVCVLGGGGCYTHSTYNTTQIALCMHNIDTETYD